MKYLFTALTILFTATFASAQFVMNFDRIRSQENCNDFNYTFNSEITIKKVKIVKIYSDDGITGSFSYEIYFDIDNRFISDKALPTGNFWAFQITLLSKITQNLTNNITLPIQTGVFKDIRLNNNPTYNGSAKALGVVEGQEYTGDEFLAIFAYENAELYINLPCLNTTVTSSVRPIFPGNTPLPVTLKNFNVTKNLNQNILAWSSSSESNFNSYIIEKSIDGKSWAQIGSVLPQSLNTSASEYSYTWIDNNIQSEKQFYRLKMLDTDGAFTYSKVNMVQSDVKNQISVSPNPAQNFINVNGINDAVNVTLYNAMGNVVKIVKVDPINDKISISDLADGIYILKLENSSSTFRFVKQ